MEKIREKIKTEYEYESEKTIGNLPLLSTNIGKGKRIAKGVFALGNKAYGIFAIGGISIGIFSLGGIAVAKNIALGGCAIADIAIGQFTIGDTEIPIETVTFETNNTIREMILQKFPNIWKPILYFYSNI